MQKGLTLTFLGTLVFCAISQPVLAREFADIYTECGIGAMIAPRNTAVAAVTNVTWDSGTTAISSNISSPDTCKGNQASAAAFIHDSYASLEKDIASGSGEFVDTLANLTGHDQATKEQFIASLRSDFSKVVTNSTYTTMTKFEKAEALYNIVYKNS